MGLVKQMNFCIRSEKYVDIDHNILQLITHYLANIYFPLGDRFLKAFKSTNLKIAPVLLTWEGNLLEF